MAKVVQVDERPVFGPCSEKQRLILLDDETDILLCGGGAGGGKSRTCLTKALKYINDPEARVLIVRRSYPMLKLSGGLIDESKAIYKYFGGVFKVQPSTWVFPNGATIQFAPIPDDVQDWQGLQVSHVLVDEAAEFTENEILFLLSRLRRVEYVGHKSIILTCNPSRDSYLYDWVKFSLDEGTGIPLPGTEHRVRYWININGKILWADSAEDLWKTHGESKGLNRDPDKGTVTFLPKTFKFIPLTVDDNAILKKKNPEYVANLHAMSRVNKLRYLYGSWTAKTEGTGYFNRDWVEFVDRPPVNPVSRVRSWDLAATVVSEVNKDPDYTAGVKISRDKFGIYYIEDVKRFRMLSDGVVREIIKTAMLDGLDETIVTIPRDPGAGGKTANSFYLRTLAENGISAKSVQVSTHTGKISRFLPFCTLAESRCIRVVRGDWNEEWLSELELFEGLKTQHDDMVDSTSDAFNTLSKQLLLPSFVLPSLEQSSPLPRL